MRSDTQVAWARLEAYVCCDACFEKTSEFAAVLCQSFAPSDP